MPKALSYQCPFCNREVRVGKPCPGCAENTGKSKSSKKSWEQDPVADGLDLPDDDFDYDAFVAREFGSSAHRRLGAPWYWWLLGILALIAMITGLISGWR
jgi:hypothetical protein